MSSEAAFFDLDKTLLPGSSLFPLARELYRQRFFDLGDIARMALDSSPSGFWERRIRTGSSGLATRRWRRSEGGGLKR
jgi:FMN phosphatase YigB (HAD superfamily)